MYLVVLTNDLGGLNDWILLYSLLREQTSVIQNPIKQCVVTHSSCPRLGPDWSSGPNIGEVIGGLLTHSLLRCPADVGSGATTHVPLLSGTQMSPYFCRYLEVTSGPFYNPRVPPITTVSGTLPLPPLRWSFSWKGVRSRCRGRERIRGR